MNRNIKFINIVLLLFTLAFANVNAQYYSDYITKKSTQRIGGFIGYNHYTGGVFNNFRSFFIASIGLEYDYKFSDKWGFGLKMDFIFPKYSIPNGLELPDILIKYPSAMVKYYFSNSFIGLIGGGAEFIEDSVYGTVKVGAEYKMMLSDDWDIKPVFSYSIVNGFEDTYEIIFSIGKNF